MEVRHGTVSPEGEEVILRKGFSSFQYYLPKLIFQGAVCYFLARFIPDHLPFSIEDHGRIAPLLNSAVITIPAIAAFWFLSTVLRFLNSRYIITSQRVVAHEGGFRRRTINIELFKLKSVGVTQGFWGQILGYGHVEIVSSERLSNRARIYGVRKYDELLDLLRESAQDARSKAGIVHITE